MSHPILQSWDSGNTGAKLFDHKWRDVFVELTEPPHMKDGLEEHAQKNHAHDYWTDLPQLVLASPLLAALVAKHPQAVHKYWKVWKEDKRVWYLIQKMPNLIGNLIPPPFTMWTFPLREIDNPLAGWLLAPFNRLRLANPSTHCSDLEDILTEYNKQFKMKGRMRFMDVAMLADGITGTPEAKKAKIKKKTP